MSSLAQEESRSISENVTWGQRKRFSDGKFSLGYSRFLGYDRGTDKNSPPIINPEQAITVKRIYYEFMTGKSASAIAKGLTQDAIPTPAGKTKWEKSTVESILQNEKYMGAARLQKTFTTDFLTKKHKKNEGEVPQYYIENSHEAIITPDEWQAVQNELARRKALGGHYSGNSILSSRLICGDCGGFYGRKVWNSTDRFRRIIWRCNDKFKGTKCSTPHVEESAIKDGFIIAFNRLIDLKDEVIENFEYVCFAMTDCSEIDEEYRKLEREAKFIADLSRKLIRDNASHALDPEEFMKQYNEYDERYKQTVSRMETLDHERAARVRRVDVLNSFMKVIVKAEGGVREFNERLWQITIDYVTIQPDGKKIYRFFNGTEIEV